MVQNAARRADHHVRTVFQADDLAAQRHAAAQRDYFDVAGGPGQTANLLRHLIGQLAGRAQHQGLDGHVGGLQLLHQGQAKGGGLAAAGAGLGDQVLARQRQRQAGRLDGRHGGVAQLGQVGHRGGREIQTRKM